MPSTNTLTCDINLDLLMSNAFKRVTPFVETALQAMTREKTDFPNIYQEVFEQTEKVEIVWNDLQDWYSALCGISFGCYDELERMHELLYELYQFLLQPFE